MRLGLAWVWLASPVACLLFTPLPQPRAAVRLFAGEELEAAPIQPEVLSGEPQIFSGVISPTTSAAPASTSTLPPGLTAADLWGTLHGACGHLEPADRLHVREGLEVLLAKISIAERAERACPSTLRPGADTPLPPRSPPAEVLHVLASVRTARDLLELKCDAPTVVAALLSLALTPRSPTWPGSCALPLPFVSEVSELLAQQSRMRALGSAASDLDDDQAYAIREALRVGLGVTSNTGGQSTGFDGGSDAGQPGAGAVIDLLQPQLIAGLTEDSGAHGGASVDGAVGELAAPTDPRVVVVLLGSALAGLRASDCMPAHQQQNRALECVQLLAPLAHSIGLGGGSFSELESLSYARLFPESLRQLRGWYMQRWPDAEALSNELCAQTKHQLSTAPSLTGLIASLAVTGRVKSVTSTFRKLLRDHSGSRNEEVRDALALRVVIDPTEGASEQLEIQLKRDAPLASAEMEALLCYTAYRQLLRLWPEVPGRFKDFVTRPKPNGYQSLHTNLQLPDGRVFEVQIRTARMHEAAERGSAAHNAYRAKQLGGSEPVRLLPPAREAEPEDAPSFSEPADSAAPPIFEYGVDVSDILCA